jgi:hypothetical protein
MMVEPSLGSLADNHVTAHRTVFPRTLRPKWRQRNPLLGFSENRSSANPYQGRDTMKKPKAKSIAPNHIAAAHAQLVRAEALLEALAYCLKYADSEKEVDPGGFSMLAEMAREQVASAVDKLDAAQSSPP